MGDGTKSEDSGASQKYEGYTGRNPSNREKVSVDKKRLPLLKRGESVEGNTLTNNLVRASCSS